MDWQLIKEKVTDEVIRQLQADGVTATPEKAQQMVAKALEAKAAPAPASEAAPAKALPTCDVGDDFKTDVLAVVAGPVCDKVVEAIKALAADAKVTVVSSGYSERLAALQACGRLVCEGNEATARRLVQGAGMVVAPVVSTSVAAKSGSLIGDCLASAVLVEAALTGKKVVVARESIVAPANATWAIRRKVEEVVSALRAMGFVLTDLSAIAGEAKKGATAPKTRGGYVPAYPPAAKAVAEAARATRTEAAATVSVEADRELAKYIDHTLLKPEATQEQITKLCQEAAEYHFMSVCVNPCWVPLCAKLLNGTDVRVCTVIGFPLGATSSTVKAVETADSIQHGATEVDMVINVSALKSKQYDVVLEDIKAVVNAARGKALTKVIIETGLLTDEEKVKACQLSKEAGADFVKTSTGFGPGGATAADIALMRKTVGPDMGVKASGGVRDYDGAMAMINAGATRIGASAGINIVKRVKARPAGGKDKY